MKVRYIRLISEKKEHLWRGQKDFSHIYDQAAGEQLKAPLEAREPLEHLRYIKERRGEKIVAVDADSGALLGWIGIFPDRDAGGPFFHLVGLQVHSEQRGKGIDTGLVEEAEAYMKSKKTSRFKFGTSPLLTQNACLYITRFGGRYRWKEGVKAPDGRPWPYVSCECDFDDPLARSLDLEDDEVLQRSVVDWKGTKPVRRKKVVYSGPLSVLMPGFTTDLLAETAERQPGFLETMYSVFQDLFVHGYGFDWFDRLPPGFAQANAPDDTPCFFYIMKKILAL